MIVSIPIIIGDLVPFRGFYYRVKDIRFIPPTEPEKIFIELVKLNSATRGDEK